MEIQQNQDTTNQSTEYINSSERVRDADKANGSPNKEEDD